MATKPTPEESAQAILAIFIDSRCKAGEVLAVQNFRGPWFAEGRTSDEFNQGLLFAIEAEWIELSTPTSYRLTQKGFAEA